MHTYSKNQLPSGVALRSLITVFSAELSDSVPDVDRHDFWELVYVIRGCYNIRSAKTERALREGEAMIHSPNTEHAGTVPSCAVICVISFETVGDELYAIADTPITLTGERRRRLSELVELGERNFVRTGRLDVRGVTPRPDAKSHELMRFRAGFELLLTELVNEQRSAAVATNRHNYKMASFCEITEAFTKNADKSLTLSELAALVSVSVTTLRELCAIGCAESPMAYFISIKMKLAKKMIKESSMNFTEISEALGYSSVHYFSKLFKEKVGMSPTEYARSLSD